MNSTSSSILWCARWPRRLCLSRALPASHAASDVVITTTGDRLVGEIKKVEKDVLTLSTDYSDSDFKIRVAKIASIESDRQFIVETFEGHRLTAHRSRRRGMKAAVQVADTSVPLPKSRPCSRFERSLLLPVRRGLDLRLTAARANSAKQFSFEAISCRDQQHLDSLFANAFRSSQENAPDTNRWEPGTTSGRLLGERSYVATPHRTS